MAKSSSGPDTIREALDYAFRYEFDSPEEEVMHARALAALVALVGRVEQLENVEKAARAFVATTSSFRQPHSSRPEFTDLALALVSVGEPK